MAITESEIEQIAQLAYLNTGDSAELATEVTAIINFVEQLRQVDTAAVAPLFHPFDLAQRLRADEISEEDCSKQLAEIAPFFEDGHYLVPKVIDSGQ